MIQNFFCAVQKGEPDLLQLFIDHGAEIDYQDAGGDYVSSLMIARK